MNTNSYVTGVGCRSKQLNSVALRTLKVTFIPFRFFELEVLAFSTSAIANLLEIGDVSPVR